MKTKYSAVLFLLSLGITSSVLASTPYDDVPLDHWAYEAVDTLTAHGVIDGYPNGTFRGDQPITCFEMAKMIRHAVLDQEEIHDKDRELLDKLANEYKEELKGFNIRIVELERRVGNIKWKGNIRYRYINDHISGGGGGMMAMFGGGDGSSRTKSTLQYLTATLEPDIKIAKNWTGHLRMNYNIDARSGNKSPNDTISGSSGGGGMMAMFGGGDGGRKVKEFSLDRAWLHGDYKKLNLQINLGRLPYTSFVDRGLVMNDSVTGAQVVYGTKYKAALTVGRINADPYGTKNSGGMMAMFGGGGASQKTHYYGVEVYTTPGKAAFGAGFHRFGNRNFDDGGGMMAMFGGGDTEKMHANIYSVGASYQFDKIFGLNAAGAWNTMKDMGYDGSKRAWQVETTFGKEDQKKAGNVTGYVAYRHLGNSVTWRPDYEVMNSGQKGWDVGVKYVIYKDIVASLRYFRGKAIKDDSKENTLFGEVYCYF
ncbi:MAG: S-layer homology domain-containing protein [Acidaminococcaceae bacterium]|nr:S-layer homology domain-containing protein [Acidaminococcaceae bacterium]